MSSRNRGKAKIDVATPDLPPFLQRLKAQVASNQEQERKEQSEKRKRNRQGQESDSDDEPTIVKLGRDDLTEEQYKKLKEDLKNKLKTGNEKRETPFELDVDSLLAKGATTSQRNDDKTKVHPSKPVQESKKLSYGSSSEEEDD